MKTVAAKDMAPGHIQSLVTTIKPIVDSTPKGNLDTVIKADVKHVVDALRSSTPILKAKIDAGDVQVIGSYYTLDTGAFTFLEGRWDFRSTKQLGIGGFQGASQFLLCALYFNVTIQWRGGKEYGQARAE
jgi:hypothetical protein